MMNSSSIPDNDHPRHDMFQYEENGKGAVAFLSILMIAGVVGNAHVLLVYGQTKMKLNYQIFIFVLAIHDFLACTLTIPFEIVLVNIWYDYTYKNATACKFFHFLSYMLMLSSVSVFTLTAVERYRRICTPFKKQLTRRTVLIACIVVSCISCLISIPVPFYYDIVPTENLDNPYLNGTTCGCWSEMFKNIYFCLILPLGSTMFIITVAAYFMIVRTLLRQRRYARKASTMFIITVAAYFMIVRTLLRQRRYARKASSNTEDNDETANTVYSRKNKVAIRNTITLMIVIAVSYLSTMPLFSFLFIKIADDAFFEETVQSLGRTGYKVITDGYFINNIINPIVYIIVDKQFRNGIRNIYFAIWTFLKCGFNNSV